MSVARLATRTRHVSGSRNYYVITAYARTDTHLVMHAECDVLVSGDSCINILGNV